MQALVVPDPVLIQINRLLFRLLSRKKYCNSKAFEKSEDNCCLLCFKKWWTKHDPFKTDANSVIAAMSWASVPSAGVP